MSKQPVSLKHLTFLILVVFFLWIGVTLLIFVFVPPDYFEHRGIVGDAFGAVNALFSGLAFAGVIYALLLQRRDLELQAEALEKQIELSRIQVNSMRQEHLRRVEPVLVIQEVNGTLYHVLNKGADISIETIITTEGKSIPWSSTNGAIVNSGSTFVLHTDKFNSEFDVLTFEMTYRDSYRDIRSAIFELGLSNKAVSRRRDLEIS